MAELKPLVWTGQPMTTADLCHLTGQGRVTLWRDVKAGLLPETARRRGVRSIVYPPSAIRRYLKLKFPHLLPHEAA